MCQVYNQDTALKPIIKWPGGKEKELEFIFPNAPTKINNYYEPFVGGGSVFMAFNANKFFINDKSKELINLYQFISKKDSEFYKWANGIETAWRNTHNYASSIGLENLFISFRNDEIDVKELKNKIEVFVKENEQNILNNLPIIFTINRNVFVSEVKINLTRKLQRMKKLELEKWVLPYEDVKSNIETAFMSALYMYFRNLYNDKEVQKQSEFHTALFLFIRNYTYSGMFRYNDAGDFNVPYGGTSYNSKTLDNKFNYYQSEKVLNKFSHTKIENLDFEDFFKQNEPQENDFVFLDPPYDSEFSTYAQNNFTREDQARLANYLCNECKAKWMMVIKATPYILSLYDNKGLNIKQFDKTYTVSFMNRNDKQAEHLIIMNYNEEIDMQEKLFA